MLPTEQHQLEFRYNDGGRYICGYKGQTGDCVTRAISIVEQAYYKDVYDCLAEWCKEYNAQFPRQRKSHPRTGIAKVLMGQYLDALGYQYVKLPKIGYRYHHLNSVDLRRLLDKRVILDVNKHVVAMINGVCYDVWDCSKNGTKCVYGYYIKYL